MLACSETDPDDTQDVGIACGLPRLVSWSVAVNNDEYSPPEETPEQRYERMLKWVRGQLHGEHPN